MDPTSSTRLVSNLGFVGSGGNSREGRAPLQGKIIFSEFNTPDFLDAARLPRFHGAVGGGVFAGEDSL